MLNGWERQKAAETWTDEKNARRAALINKKHDRKLTSAEARELNQLTEEVRQFQERVAPLHNHVLELILEALDRRTQEAARMPGAIPQPSCRSINVTHNRRK